MSLKSKSNKIECTKLQFLISDSDPKRFETLHSEKRQESKTQSFKHTSLNLQSINTQLTNSILVKSTFLKSQPTKVMISRVFSQ